MDKYTGKRLDGRYEINELIGVGGMAMVYRAYDIIDDRTVAIKILKDEFLNNADFIRRFRNESKAVAVMSHPNIVKVYDVSFGDVIQYIVMEYIDGITLKEYIAQQKEIGWKEALHFIVQILNALKHAHEKGIIHRDIKPQNIMLLQDGTIKVTDFGIARFSNKETRTMTDKAIGSVHYIAPEQARGDITDNKSDLYSVGVMMYELLTGKLPFEADNAVSVAIMQLQTDPKPLKEINPEIPDGLEEITLKAMQKNPAKRYASADEMLADIEMFRQNPSIKFQYTYFDDDTSDKYATAISNVRSNSFEDSYDTIEDIEEGEEDIKTARSPVMPIILGAVTALVLILLIFTVAGVTRSCSKTVEDVDVPLLVGLNYKNQVENNSKYNFTWNIQSAYDENKPIGEILEQNPKAGSKKIKVGSEITITVNSSEINTVVPGIIGLEEEDAIARITKNSLGYEIIEVIDDNTAKGYVVSSSPKPGTEVFVDSTVTVYVSTGTTIDQIEVPYLVDCTMSEAQNKLNQLGLALGGSEYEENDAKKDTIISQSPLWGAKVSKGTKVSIVLSAGPSEETTLKQTIPMPDYNGEISYKVIVGDSEIIRDRTINPSSFTDNVIERKGKTDTTEKITVELNGEVYRIYTFDYKNKKIITEKEVDFVPPADDTQASDTENTASADDASAGE
ncbi:MAG: Stk1 family PASTA domain-containing Ser/Thr kinase [Clostridiales bacterium]|nr:Stk1 family PASTA domain-containing Ser/Thr kinase [Clostridiales bacterium]